MLQGGESCLDQYGDLAFNQRWKNKRFDINIFHRYDGNMAPLIE